MAVTRVRLFQTSAGKSLSASVRTRCLRSMERQNYNSFSRKKPGGAYSAESSFTAALGSTLKEVPMVDVTARLLMYCPLAAAGFALTMARRRALPFS